jgi:hypothetical protein
MSIEAMKQALEAMGLMGADLICEAAHHGKKDRHGIGEPCHIQQRWHKAFDALRTAIAEAEKQEQCKEHGECFGGKCIYITPPAAQRTWVGLTDAEIEEWDYDVRDVVMDTEKLLREKNT